MNNREWLYGMEPSDLAAWFDAEHVEPDDGIKPESVVKSQSVDANGEKAAQDSREKLEDDVGFIVKEGFVTYKSIIGWLDRQAAITEEQTRYKQVTASAYEIAELKRERDDLKAQIDEILAGDKATDAINAELAAKVKDLESQVEVWMDAAANAHDMWEKADSRRVEVERECDSLVIDLADCERVIADLRGKLFRACDNAHDTLRMMDEGLA